MARFRKRPVEVDAEQFTDPNNPPRGVNVFTPGRFYVTTKQGENVFVKEGEWIIAENDPPGRFYPCDPAEFARIYEPVESPAAPS